MKFPVTEEDEQFSRWTESMRKDVECAFGILKRQFTILSVPISIHSLDKVDQIWKTCCALHNWLLQIDGLDTAWDGVGCEANNNNAEVSLPLQWLSSDMRVPPAVDEGATGGGTENVTGTFEIDQEGVNVVRLLSQKTFRDKLVIHLNIAWAKKKLKWPVKKTEQQNMD